MPVQFDNDWSTLKKKLLHMGAMAEQMIRDMLAVVAGRQLNLMDEISRKEQQMDILQNEIDEETVRMITVHTPVAGDLRMLIVAARINAELERIGDQIMNIGFYAKSLLAEEHPEPVDGIPDLAEMAGDMVSAALDAFTQKSGQTARVVVRADNNVDQLHDQIFRKLMARAAEGSKAVTGLLELILIARSFERIADHAVSIAEDVIYMVEAKNIRHAHDVVGDNPEKDEQPQKQSTDNQTEA